MLRGFYTAAAGMIAQQRRQEMLSNNLANANTPGYKADQASLRAFPEMLLSQLGRQELPNNRSLPINRQVGAINTGVYMQEVLPKFTQGDITQTGNQTDIALVQKNLPINEETNRPGALFFEVQNNDGELRYTRNGSFTLDGQGYITTAEGFYLLDEGGSPIQIFGGDFTVGEDGTISESGQAITRINVAYAENPDTLVKAESGLYQATGEDGFLPTAIGSDDITFEIKQGYIEQSNVDLQKTMTEMMMAYRSFETNQKVLQAYDRSLEKAVNEIGRIG